MLRTLLISGLFLAAASPALAQQQPAQAQTDDARAVPVRFTDLDLNQTRDAQAMLSRLETAATRACAVTETDRLNASARRAVDECRQDAVHHAVARIAAPELTRLHAARD